MSRYFRRDKDDPATSPTDMTPDQDDAGDDDLPVLDDIVTPGRDGATVADWAQPQTDAAVIAPDARFTGLLTEIIDLALDDALDRLRPELHARLCEHLEQRLPELLAASRQVDSDDD